MQTAQQRLFGAWSGNLIACQLEILFDLKSTALDSHCNQDILSMHCSCTSALYNPHLMVTDQLLPRVTMLWWSITQFRLCADYLVECGLWLFLL